MHLKAQLQPEKLRPTSQRSNVNQHLVGGSVLSVRLAPGSGSFLSTRTLIGSSTGNTAVPRNPRSLWKTIGCLLPEERFHHRKI